MLDVAVITLKCRMQTAALFDAFVLRNVAGTASAAIQGGIVDPFNRRMWVRVAAYAGNDGCAVCLRVAVPAVWQVAMLDVAEGAVQGRMFAASGLQRLVLWRVAIHAFSVPQLRIYAVIR